jgi:hypothetical protein
LVSFGDGVGEVRMGRLRERGEHGEVLAVQRYQSANGGGLALAREFFPDHREVFEFGWEDLGEPMLG